MTEFQNRSFLYGDGLFETMRLQNGRIIFLQEHFERLSHGMQTLQMQQPEGFSPQWLETQILKAINDQETRTQKGNLPKMGVEMEKDANSPNRRVRITFYREAGGLYTPLDNNVRWDVIFSPLLSQKYVLNEIGYLVGKYKDVRLSADILSPLKTTSALPYVMAGLYRKTKHPEWDDCLLLNQAGRVAEAMAANIFLRIGDSVYTPSLEEGCVSGVLRRVLIDWLWQHHIPLEECALTATHFHEADEIWLTNVIQGIRWVQELSFVPNRLYHPDWAARVVAGLNEKMGC